MPDRSNKQTSPNSELLGSLGNLGDEPGALDALGEVGGAPRRVDGGGHGSDEPEPWRPPRRPRTGLPEASRRGGVAGEWSEGGRVGPAGGRRRLHQSEGLRFGGRRGGAGEEEGRGEVRVPGLLSCGPSAWYWAEM